MVLTTTTLQVGGAAFRGLLGPSLPVTVVDLLFVEDPGF